MSVTFHGLDMLVSSFYHMIPLTIWEMCTRSILRFSQKEHECVYNYRHIVNQFLILPFHFSLDMISKSHFPTKLSKYLNTTIMIIMTNNISAYLWWLNSKTIHSSLIMTKKIPDKNFIAYFPENNCTVLIEKICFRSSDAILNMQIWHKSGRVLQYI